MSTEIRKNIKFSFIFRSMNGSDVYLSNNAALSSDFLKSIVDGSWQESVILKEGNIILLDIPFPAKAVESTAILLEHQDVTMVNTDIPNHELEAIKKCLKYLGANTSILDNLEDESQPSASCDICSHCTTTPTDYYICSSCGEFPRLPHHCDKCTHRMGRSVVEHFVLCPKCFLSSTAEARAAKKV